MKAGGESLQWSHVHSNVETSTLPTEPSRLTSGFNGATFIQTWKRTLHRYTSLSVDASMEPRSFKRGNDVLTGQIPYKQACFNGATFIQTWKRCIWPKSERAVVGASMEPRSFKRGNSARPKFACQSAYRSRCERSPVNARHSTLYPHLLQAFAVILHHLLPSSDPRLSPHRSTARLIRLPQPSPCSPRPMPVLSLLYSPAPAPLTGQDR